MKVKELIKLLKECDQESDLYFEYTYYIDNVPYDSLNDVTHVKDHRPDSVYIS